MSIPSILMWDRLLGLEGEMTASHFSASRLTCLVDGLQVCHRNTEPRLGYQVPNEVVNHSRITVISVDWATSDKASGS